MSHASKTFAELLGIPLQGPDEVAALYAAVQGQRPMGRDARWLRDVLARSLGALHTIMTNGEGPPLDSGVPAQSTRPAINPRAVPAPGGRRRRGPSMPTAAQIGARMVAEMEIDDLIYGIENGALGEAILSGIHDAETAGENREPVIAALDKVLAPAGADQDLVLDGAAAELVAGADHDAGPEIVE